MKNYLILGLIAISFLITLVATGRGLEYYIRGAQSGRAFYVDSTGGNDSNTGRSETSPFRSLAKIENAGLLPGDTVYLKKGSTFRGRLELSRSGTVDRPITITSYGSGSSPTLDASNSEDRKGLSISASYLVIEDLSVINAAYAAFELDPGADNNTIQDTFVSNSGIAYHVRGRNNLLARNVAQDLKMIKNTRGGDDDYGAVGFFIENTGNEVAYSKCLRCLAPSFDYGNDGGFVELYGTTDNSFIHHNYAEDTNGFIEVGSGDSSSSANNVRVAYNVSYNNREDFMVLHLANNFRTSVTGMRVENNTIVYRLNDPEGMTIFHIDGTPTRDTLHVKRNIVVTSIPFSNKTGFTREENVIQVKSSSLAGALGTRDILADPQFVNLEGKDLRLKSTSRAINISTATIMDTDYDGRPVPQGGKTDAGAFEYSSVSTAPAPTTAPNPTQAPVPTTPPSASISRSIKIEAVIPQNSSLDYVVFDGIIEDGVVRDVDSSVFRYSPNWYRNSNRGANNTPGKVTTQNGATIEFSTKAKTLVIQSVKYPSVASMKIYVNGVLKKTVEGYAQTLQYTQISVPF